MKIIWDDHSFTLQNGGDRLLYTDAQTPMV